MRWAQAPLAQLERGHVDALLTTLEQLAAERQATGHAEATATLRMLLLSNRWKEVSTYCRSVS